MATSNITKDGFEYDSVAAPNGFLFSNVCGDGANETQYWANVIFVGEWDGNEHRAVFQLGSVAIGKSQVVTSANLVLNYEGCYKDTRFRVFAVLNSAGFGVVSGANLASSAVRTTAASAFVQMSLIHAEPPYSGSGYWIPTPATLSVDVKTVVQEVVNGANWTANSSITFIVIPVTGFAGHTRFYADEHASQPAARMIYEVSVSPAIASAPATLLNVTQVVTVTTENVTGTIQSVTISKGTQSQAQSLASATISNNQFTFNWVQGALAYGSGYTLTVVTQSHGTLTRTIALAPQFAFVTVADIANLTDISLGYQAAPAIAVGDIFDYDTTTNLGSTASINARGEPTISGASTGEDFFYARYRAASGGVWSDVRFKVEFFDKTYLGQNQILPIQVGVVLNSFLVTAGSSQITPIVSQAVFNTISTTTALTENANTGYVSVNSPTLKVIDSGSTLNLYSNRDNTGEFQFLESGVAVDLLKATRIELKIGTQMFSDGDFIHANKFKKSPGGLLEVQLGELGLPNGDYKFYFIVYTPTQANGIVWGRKDQYTLSLSSA